MGVRGMYTIVCSNGHLHHLDYNECCMYDTAFNPFTYPERSAGFPKASPGIRISPDGQEPCLIVDEFPQYLWTCPDCGAFAEWVEDIDVFADAIYHTPLMQLPDGRWVPEAPGGRYIDSGYID